MSEFTLCLLSYLIRYVPNKVCFFISCPIKTDLDVVPAAGIRFYPVVPPGRAELKRGPYPLNCSSCDVNGQRRKRPKSYIIDGKGPRLPSAVSGTPH